LFSWLWLVQGSRLGDGYFGVLGYNAYMTSIGNNNMYDVMAVTSVTKAMWNIPAGCAHINS